MRIALTGNPNSGKTTMYNALTGRNEKIGNWAGVTVDRKESGIKKAYYDGGKEVIAVDLPGAYSMSPFTSEESITSSYVKNENPDVIINIVDATNLSRSLFFTTQLLELGIPVVVALNKSDVNEKKGTKIDVAKLSEKLGCPVVETVSTSSNGLKDVVTKAVEIAGGNQKAPYSQGNIDLHDKAEVEKADRQRFDFVNAIVKEVETRKVLTNENIKMIAIDGIVPNYQTISKGEYPFLNYSQVIIRKGTPKDSNVYKVIDWILQGNGDQIAEKLGYVPNHIKND